MRYVFAGKDSRARLAHSKAFEFLCRTVARISRDARWRNTRNSNAAIGGKEKKKKEERSLSRGGGITIGEMKRIRRGRKGVLGMEN